MFAPRGWLSRSVARASYGLFTKSSYFDVGWYRKNQLHGLSKIQDPIWHYISVGSKKALQPSPLFDPEYYSEKNDDVRVAKINPLHHYLAHGRAERRLPLRSAKETIDYYLPDAADLRTFLVPSLGQRRVSLLLDSLSGENLNSRIGDALFLAAEIALHRGATLRVLYRGIEIGAEEVSHSLESFGPEFLRSLEMTRAPNTKSYSDIPVFGDEVSLASSWSSAQAMRFTSDQELSFVLLKVGSTPAGTITKVSLPPKTSVPPGLVLANNTTDLREVWRNHVMPLPRKAPDNLAKAFAPACEKAGPWRLAVVATPQSNPGNYALAIEAIDRWLMKKSPRQSDIEIFFLAEEGKPLSFLEEIRPVFLSEESGGIFDAKVHAVLILATDDAEFTDDLCSRGIDVVSASHSQSEPSLSIDSSGAACVSTSPRAGEIAKGLEVLHRRFTEITMGSR